VAVVMRAKKFSKGYFFCVAFFCAAVHKDRANMAILPKDRLEGRCENAGPFFRVLKGLCWDWARWVGFLCGAIFMGWGEGDSGERGVMMAFVKPTIGNGCFRPEPAAC
jgi:hypothetical protein